MNYASRATAVVPAVSLAEEEEFRLGALLVRPSTREVVFDGRSEIVEPRVMQVLVVLAQAEGAVVSRDRLIERCWGGRIVGDDAINNCVSKVRALASLTPAPAFEIGTIPRVGYRMQAAKTAELPLPAGQTEIADNPAVTQTITSAQPVRLNVQRPILLFLATVLVMGGIAAGIVLLWPRPPAAWTIVESHMPFIATPLVERAPDFSPNGSMIAYSAGPDYLHRSIYLRLLSGGEPLRLVGRPLSGYSPVWSPDGSQIAFSSFTSGKPCTMMLIAALGGRPREVGHCRTTVFPFLAWDRTTTGLLFNDAQNGHAPAAIYRLDLNGGPTRQLTHPQGGPATQENGGTISPDGKTLAVLRQISFARNQIVLRNLASGLERVLLSTTDNDDPFAWSNDSTTLFIGRNMPWDSSLWAYPVDGSAPQRITDITSTIGWVSSGPNGLLAVDLERSEFDLAVASPLPGQPARSIDANGPGAYSIAYSRDGTLAATAARSGVTSLLLSDSNGTLHQLLRLNSYIAGLLSWSADGERLAFVAQDNQDFAITVLNRDGQILKRIHYPAKEMGGLDWSEDSSSLLVTSEDAHGWRTWRLKLSGNTDSVPVAPYGWMFVVSRGRMTFGVKDGVGGIWRLDGTPKRLTAWPDAQNSNRWALCGDRLIYADFTNPDVPVVMALPIAGGAPKPIGYPSGLLPGAKFAFNPKDGLITYLRVTREDTDIGWMRVKRE